MSAKGTSNFIAQRATAVILLPLVIWFLWSVIAHASADYGEMRAWLAEIPTTLAFAALIVIGALHMRIGLGEVIEDYIHAGLKGVFMTLNWLAALAVAGGGVFAAYKLVFAG